MKKIKKLKLEKDVIANLNNLEMNEIKGGTNYSTDPICKGDCTELSAFYGDLCRSGAGGTSHYCDLYTFACAETQSCQCYPSQFSNCF